MSYQGKIKYVSKPNGGVSSALNVGISHMKGDYFSWLSHDDKYTPTKIEEQVKLLCKYRNQRVIALCGSQFIDKTSKVTTHRCNDRFSTEHVAWESALINLYDQGTYNGCAFLISKKYFDECGGFDEQLRFAQDTLMWSKLLISGCDIVYSSFIGVQSRIHDGQQTQKSRHLLKHDSEKIAECLVPLLVEKNQRKAIYLYAKRNAKLNNNAAVCVCKTKGNLTNCEKASLFLFAMYGIVRPLIRKIYYAMFWRVNTK